MSGTDWSFWPGLILGGVGGTFIGWWSHKGHVVARRVKRAVKRDA